MRILYPTDWMPYTMDEQQLLNEKFLGAMEDVFGVKHEKTSLAASGRSPRPPTAANGKSIAGYLKNVRYNTSPKHAVLKRLTRQGLLTTY
jgi:hypothetical protein